MSSSRGGAQEIGLVCSSQFAEGLVDKAYDAEFIHHADTFSETLQQPGGIVVDGSTDRVVLQRNRPEIKHRKLQTGNSDQGYRSRVRQADALAVPPAEWKNRQLPFLFQQRPPVLAPLLQGQCRKQTIQGRARQFFLTVAGSCGKKIIAVADDALIIDPQAGDGSLIQGGEPGRQ